MEAFYTSGTIIDLVLFVVAIEFLVLTLVHHRTGSGIAPQDAAINLLSAIFLLLALRSVLMGASWWWMAAFLAASFPAHLLDLRRRWNNPARLHRPDAETGIAPGRSDR